MRFRDSRMTREVTEEMYLTRLKAEWTRDEAEKRRKHRFPNENSKTGKTMSSKTREQAGENATWMRLGIID